MAVLGVDGDGGKVVAEEEKSRLVGRVRIVPGRLLFIGVEGRDGSWSAEIGGRALPWL